MLNNFPWVRSAVVEEHNRNGALSVSDLYDYPTGSIGGINYPMIDQLKITLGIASI